MRKNLKKRCKNIKIGYNKDVNGGKRYVVSIYCKEFQEHKR